MLRFVMLLSILILFSGCTTEYGFQCFNHSDGFIRVEPFNIYAHPDSVKGWQESSMGVFTSDSGGISGFTLPHKKQLKIFWRYWQSKKDFERGLPGEEHSAVVKLSPPVKSEFYNMELCVLRSEAFIVYSLRYDVNCRENVLETGCPLDNLDYLGDGSFFAKHPNASVAEFTSAMHKKYGYQQDVPFLKKLLWILKYGYNIYYCKEDGTPVYKGDVEKLNKGKRILYTNLNMLRLYEIPDYISRHPHVEQDEFLKFSTKISNENNIMILNDLSVWKKHLDHSLQDDPIAVFAVCGSTVMGYRFSGKFVDNIKMEMLGDKYTKPARERE